MSMNEKCIEKIVKIDLNDIIDCNLDQFLDLVSEEVIGGVYPCLMDISYEVVGFEAPHTIIIKVDGVYEPDEDEMDDDNDQFEKDMKRCSD